jgi:hypothetical protein
MYGKHYLEALLGKTVREIWMDRDNLTFVTEDGPVTYSVYGDCCSESFFFDFYGVNNVIEREVVAFEKVDLSPGDPGYRAETFEVKGDEEGWKETEVYGYRITTEHEKFGHVSAVLSFRNESNGYYGGYMELTDHVPAYLPENRVLADVIGE